MNGAAANPDCHVFEERIGCSQDDNLIVLLYVRVQGEDRVEVPVPH